MLDSPCVGGEGAKPEGLGSEGARNKGPHTAALLLLHPVQTPVLKSSAAPQKGEYDAAKSSSFTGTPLFVCLLCFVNCPCRALATPTQPSMRRLLRRSRTQLEGCPNRGFGYPGLIEHIGIHYVRPCADKRLKAYHRNTPHSFLCVDT